MDVDILGTTYKIIIKKISEDEDLKNRRLSGRCNRFHHEIIVADMEETEYFGELTETEKTEYKKEVLRHEIVHAYLNESGLVNNAHVFGLGWATNEEMVGWIALQFPKMIDTFRQAGAI